MHALSPKERAWFSMCELGALTDWIHYCLVDLGFPSKAVEIHIYMQECFWIRAFKEIVIS